MLINGIGAIVFGLWLMSQGTGPGDSIMVVLGLPVLLVGVVLTIIGIIQLIKKAAREDDDSNSSWRTPLAERRHSVSSKYNNRGPQ